MEDSSDPWDYEPPEVAWVPIKDTVTRVLPTGEHVEEEKVTGFRVEPPFGLTWEPLQTLQHFAALIEHRTGAKIRVIKVEHKIASAEYDEQPDLFEIRTEHVAGQAAPYEVAYAWLSGYENGIHAILWSASEGKV